MKTVCLTLQDRFVLAQLLHHREVKGTKYEERRARRRVAESLGIRKGKHWDLLPSPEDKERAFMFFGVKDGEVFKRARKLGNRQAQVSDEAIDMLLMAITKTGGADVDEDALLDLEEKLHALKDGTRVDDGYGLPGVDQVSDEDAFDEDSSKSEDDEE